MATNQSHAERLGAFVAETRTEDLPGPIVAKTKRHILDTFGAGLAGATSEESRRVCAMIEADGEIGNAVIWGRKERATPRAAALANGVAAHSFELDDTGGCDHSGAVVLPAAMSALGLSGETVSGAEFIKAIILGYDLGRRVMEGFSGYEPHNAAGWHSTGTCGTFAAAAAAASILRLDARQCASAIALAASFSGGLWAFIHDGSQAKRIHAGRAAEGGLLAALLARQGVTGPARIFDDVWGGFFPAFAHDQTDVEALVRDLGSVWKMESAGIKPYASCGGTHSAVDAVGKLMEKPGVTLENISEVRARMSPFLHGMCGGRDVALMPAAQMSLPYAVAARMAFGGAGLSAYADERRSDPGLHKAMAKVVLSTDDRMAPNDEPFITIVLAGGRELNERVTVALGAPGNPLADDALLAKFNELAGMVLSSAKVSELADTVLTLDRLADSRSLPALLAQGSA
ncbi:2-methylcitrate dehydratase PrpD [Rhizobiales bacterium GAS191]|nr:2-methylcitrate dehydratase PrpD [Rhizobiales bacterium GAS191]